MNLTRLYCLTMKNAGPQGSTTFTERYGANLYVLLFDMKDIIADEMKDDPTLVVSLKTVFVCPSCKEARVQGKTIYNEWWCPCGAATKLKEGATS